MKERPIIFNADMVRAILDGRKTQTRRIVKPAKDKVAFGVQLAPCEIAAEVNNEQRFDFCPYGIPGDRLWVRETLIAVQASNPDRAHQFAYSADKEWVDPPTNAWEKSVPSRQMPRWASRITLEVTNVRVERLQDISEEDAQAEGICSRSFYPCDGYPLSIGYTDKPPNYDKVVLMHPTRVEAYEALWRSIYGPDSWDANPWVWVVEFRRVKA